MTEKLASKYYGRFFTPMTVCNYMVQLGMQFIEKKEIKILDPSCGNGNFLVACIENFQRLSGEGFFHLRLWGVEIDDREIAKASSILTNIQQEHQTPNFKIDFTLLNRDFFDVLIKRPRSFPEQFDMIIGNPPYVRHELISDKNNLRKKICFINSKYNGDACSSSMESCRGCKKLSHVLLNAKADLYCYFITSANKLLKEQGTLLFIIPTKWLNANYGRKLRKFLVNNFRIEKLILVEKNLFPRVLVDSIVIKLFKEPDSQHRDSNILTYSTFESMKSRSVESKDPSLSNSKKINQKDLNNDQNWFNHLERPSILEKVLKQEGILSLGHPSLGHVKWGLKTGAEKFFFLSPQQVLDYQIPPEYTKLTIKSPKDLFRDKGHHLYSNLLTIPPINKNELPVEIINYLNLGEKMGLPHRASIKSRKPWYSISINKPPDIIVPNFIWKTPLLFLENIDKVIPSYNFHAIYLLDHSSINYLLALLNSTFGQLFSELFGRSEGGGVLHLQTCDVMKIPVLNPKIVDIDEKKALERLYLEYRALISKSKIESVLLDEAKKALDEAVSTHLTHNCDSIKEKSDMVLKTVRLKTLKLKSRRISRTQTSLDDLN
ncbi:MAG: HsdM family class I SAM-dependent methyltransferase [Candidatus Hodarchaeales archaeon]